MKNIQTKLLSAIKSRPIQALFFDSTGGRHSLPLSKEKLDYGERIRIISPMDCYSPFELDQMATRSIKRLQQKILRLRRAKRGRKK